MKQLPNIEEYHPSQGDIHSLFSQWEWYARRLSEGGLTYKCWAREKAKEFHAIVGISIEQYLGVEP